MTNPSTYSSTPPQSARIGQPTKSSAVVLQGYTNTNFPSIAFLGQIAIDLSSNTLMFYDSAGAWQGVLSAADVQKFYGPNPPPSGMNLGDQWYNTTLSVWFTWNGSGWLAGTVAYTNGAPGSPTVGQGWFNTTTQQMEYWNGTSWVPGTDPSAPTVVSGAMPAAANAGTTWTDANGTVWTCTSSYSGGGSYADWSQFALSGDPLAALIHQNGQLIQAQEQPNSVQPSLSNVAPTLGLVWQDVQVHYPANSNTANPRYGAYYVASNVANVNNVIWQPVTVPSTLVLCAGLAISQNAPGIVGTNLNYIWPDPLADLISLNSDYAPATGSQAANTGPPTPLSTTINVANITSNTATINVSSTVGMFAGRLLTISGSNVASLNGTWNIAQVIPASVIAQSANTAQVVFTANVANVATQNATGTAALPFRTGDVSQDTTTAWFVFDSNTTTGTWADWGLVTYPSTIAMCATVATQQLPNLLSQALIKVANDVSTGATQNLPADLSAAFNDLLELIGAQYQPLDVALLNYANTSGQYQHPSVLYFGGTDQPSLSNVGTMGISLMNTYSASDVQGLANVTDAGWTGSATKISSAVIGTGGNFLGTYLSARGFGTGVL